MNNQLTSHLFADLPPRLRPRSRRPRSHPPPTTPLHLATAIHEISILRTNPPNRPAAQLPNQQPHRTKHPPPNLTRHLPPNPHLPQRPHLRPRRHSLSKDRLVRGAGTPPPPTQSRRPRRIFRTRAAFCEIVGELYDGGSAVGSGCFPPVSRGRREEDEVPKGFGGEEGVC